MRSEAEMMDLIMGFAENDDRVRAVTMEGSRMNPDAPADCFQDYDVAFLVTGIESFLESDGWLEIFGERVIMQKPEAMHLFSPSYSGNFAYLMQFSDGNRIDLTLIAPENAREYASGKEDSLRKILLDKDGKYPPLPEPCDKSYHVKKPSPESFEDSCNEFWWVSTYVAKGLCRGEFLYAAEHFEVIKGELLRMLSWKAGLATGFSVSVGKSYKYLRRYIDENTWNHVLALYHTSSETALETALFDCCGLFCETSGFVADGLGYLYPDYGAKVLPYLKRMLQSAGQ